MNLPKQLQELKPLKQWVCYQKRWNEANRKFNKFPKDPATGKGAKANDPATWATYDEAIAARERFFFDGVGFEFAGGYAGIDLDDVIGEGGELNAIAAEIVAAVDSYTEYSPSGKGLHILFKLTEPLSNFSERNRNDEIGLEMYDSGRFFTVTGQVYGEEKGIEERTEEVKKIYEKYLKRKEEKETRPYTPVVSCSDSDDDVRRKMFNSAKGREIQALYSGDISGYNDDHSRADQALANHLAYWTNCDSGQIDRMFRESGLYRPKWDEKHSGMGETYGALTIAKAIAGTSVYIPPVRLTVRGRDSSVSVHEDSIERGTSKMLKENAVKKLPENVKQYISSVLMGDLKRFQSFKDRKTGFSNIDAKMGFYPGLYVLGAISSLGKTTFAHQMADQLVKAGDHVLFFSFEQTRLELITKGLSRITAQQSERQGFTTAVSAINIRRGVMNQAVKDAMRSYSDFAEIETVIECPFDTTIDKIVGTVKEYMEQTGVKPVVFVDYLQLIRPVDSRQSTKEAVDSHVRALKELQRDNDLVLVLISSLNRQNYLTPIDFESFKESGGIEYTADAIFGLQLQVMNNAIFDKKEGVKEKREMVKAAKKEIPRRIEFVCLKNRSGEPIFSCGFRYFAEFDYFVPMSQAEFDSLSKDEIDTVFKGMKVSKTRV